MFEFFANIFGYVLNFIYQFVNNYGLAMILFTLVIKLIMLPLSIKQQKTMKKSLKLQEKMKVIQFKYKNDQEKLNQENSNWKSMMKIIISVILIVITFSIPVGMTELTLGEKGETDYTYYDKKGRTVYLPAYFSNKYELQYKNIYYITLWKEYTSISINDIWS